MKILKNEKGVALVTSLLLTLISLGMVMALLQIVLMQTKISGAHKRYKNSLEAAHGGVQLIAKEIIPMLFNQDIPDPKATLTSEFTAIDLDTSSNDCLKQKLTSTSGSWTACGADSQTMEAKKAWDLSFKLPGVSGAGYQVYAKIVDSKPGNSDTSGQNLDSGAGVAGASNGVDPMHVPGVYRIEAVGESTTNSKEKAELTVFYSY
jgi:Tfp pilus assembly protein PilX